MRRSDDFLPARQGRERGLSPWSEGSLFTPSSFFGASPWQTMRRMQEDMDRIFSQFFEGGVAPARSGQQTGMQTWAPSMDISQSDREWCIEADLPGVKEDDIHVEVRDNHLILRAEMRQEEQPQGAQAGAGQQQKPEPQQPERQRQYFQRERRYGYFQRLLPLPENVDEDNISCDFDNGVLTIHLPKTEQARQQPRRIPVSKGRAASELSEPRGNGRPESRKPAMSGTKGGEAGTEQNPPEKGKR